MSTLKTNNIEHVDASTPSVQMSIGGGVVFPGISTFTGNATFSAGVSIGGTLTYEDVTSIDSVGVITARSGVNVTGGHIDFVDNSKIRIGTGNDLQIYHDGSTSYIDDTGTGGLDIRGNEVKISTHESETMAVFSSNAAVSLRYNNSTKFQTTNTGATVTGTLSATAFSGDGSALTGIAGTANVSTNTLNVAGVSTFSGAINSNSNVTTTADLDSRYLYVKDIFMEDVSPELRFTDSDENPDYRIRLNAGSLGIRDITNNVDKMVFSTAGVNIPVSNVGVQTNFPTSSTLVGAASSLIGMYIGDGHMLFSDNLSRSGGYYIPNGLNALNAGPVTLNSTMTLDGVWVIV